ncbi:hypothetical protein [Nocardia rhizosphaerae]|uniref:Uncharacterized protein n=1 Tax=Nocardia rhizosphaerae TaxID=1691571 RepID=A0ABV8LCR1_9NOCA
MASSELQKKLILHREKVQLQQLENQLVGIEVEGYRQPDSISPAALDALREFGHTSTKPNLGIDDTEPEDAILAWYHELLRNANIGDRFYCYTGMENFSYLDCRIKDARWLKSLRDNLGDSLDFIAEDERSVAMTHDDEYRILGFYRIL